MKINFNRQGNGACPSCKKKSSCLIRWKLADSLTDIKGEDNEEIDVVIYLCPVYEE